MKSDDTLHERETKPQATGATSPRRVCAIEPVEHMRQVVGRYSDASITDLHKDIAPALLCPHRDGSAGWRVVQCIRDKVANRSLP